MSLISPLGIVIAKLFNSLGLIVLVILAMLPVMSTAFFLVGVEFTTILLIFCATLLVALACASIGLACSTLFRKSIVSIVVSYISVVLFMIGPVILAYLYAVTMSTMSYSRGLFSLVEQIAEATSPVFLLIGALNRDIQLFNLITCLAYQVFVIVCCLLIAWYNVKKPPKPPKISQEKPIDDVKQLNDRKMGFPFYILDPLKRKKPIEDSRNPMMVREIRWGLMNRGTTLVRVFYVAFLIYFLVGAASSVDGRTHESMRNWFMVQIMLTIATAPGLIANSLTKEYELGNLDMLRMTLLSPREIILGKYTAGFASLSPILFAALFSAIPVMILGMTDLEVMFVGYTTLLVCSILSISIGLFASLVTKQTTVSIMVSYMICFVMYFGLTLVLDRMVSGDLPIYFSPALVLLAILDPRFMDEGIKYTEWGLTMSGWLVVATLFLSMSLYLFYRNKMQDH